MKQVFINNIPSDFKKDEHFVYLAIVGSRSITDESLVNKYIKTFIDAYSNKLNIPASSYVIVSGGARGVDTFAEKFADKNGLPSVIIKPDWERFGRKAGMIRNGEIARLSDVVLAFVDKDTGGTWDTIKKSKKLNKRVYVFNVLSRRFLSY